MDTKVKTITGTDGVSFVDEECTIILEGKEFTAGGAFILQRSDTGKWEAIVYAQPETGEVINWDGSWRNPAQFSRPSRNNLGSNIQHVWFTWKGIKFYGKYGCDWSQLVRCRQVNS